MCRLEPQCCAYAARDVAVESWPQPQHGHGEYYRLGSIECRWKWVCAHRVTHVGREISQGFIGHCHLRCGADDGSLVKSDCGLTYC